MPSSDDSSQNLRMSAFGGNVLQNSLLHCERATIESGWAARRINIAHFHLLSSQRDDLLPQHEDLGLQRRAWSEQIDDNPKNYSAEIQHPAEDHPILRLTPTG